MLPKGHQHRGITIFSMLHRITYGSLWNRLKAWQEQWLDEDQHGGRIKGEHLADAWDLQSRIEEANATEADI